jgi:putative ABC transport system permease protein
MFFTYLRRELFNRKRQTIVVSLGLALGVALVFTVSAVSNGVQQSQKQVLQSLYGLGTDISVTKVIAPDAADQGGRRFSVDGGTGQRDANGNKAFSRSRLLITPGNETFDAYLSLLLAPHGHYLPLLSRSQMTFYRCFLCRRRPEFLSIWARR